VRYLITGGAGFIGSHLTDALVARGDEVLVLDDLSTGRAENIADAVVSGRVEFVEGSVCDIDVVDECMEWADACFHLASAVGVKLIVERPVDTLNRSVRGAQVVIEGAHRLGRRLLFASTSEIYGKNSEGLTESSDRVLGPPSVARWSYSTAKALAETIALGYHREREADNVVARLFNTVGPRQTGAYGMVLPRFVGQAIAGEDLTVYGDGSQSRCFSHVHDTTRALVMLMDEEGARGRAFNVGRSSEITILELAEKVIERVGSATSGIEMVPYEEAYGEGFEELGRRRPDTTALEQMTGWRSTRGVEEAIDDVAAYERVRLADPLDPLIDAQA
jgi:nucleoside-diphosphate-sugar epimerase